MSRTPSACAPRSSDSRAIRFRSRVVKWTRHSRSRSCWMPNATDRQPIRTRAMALSLTLTRSTPAAWRSRAASIVRSMRIERGGSISTETTNRPAARRSARPVGGGGSSLEVALGRGGQRSTGVGARRGRRRRSAVAGPSSAVAPSVSIATRIAAMCSGVVPQQPPTIRAPWPTIRGDHLAEVRGSGRVDELAGDALGQPGVRQDRAGDRLARRTGPDQRVEAGDRSRAAVDPDDVDAGVDQGRRRGLRRRPVEEDELLAEREGRDDRQVRGGPCLGDRPRGRPRAPRTSRSRTGRRRPRGGRRPARARPSGRRPGRSVPGRGSGRRAARSSPATSASRPATSRASRATWAARRFRRWARSASPNAARRSRLAPNVAVSMRSAPASRYSRWMAPMRSGRVVASSSRHARWGMPRLYRSVPIAPSARSGPRARRSWNRARGVVGLRLDMRRTG